MSVVGDPFSKWVEAYPVPNEKAEAVAQTFVSEFVCRFGAPIELHIKSAGKDPTYIVDRLSDVVYRI